MRSGRAIYKQQMCRFLKHLILFLRKLFSDWFIWEDFKLKLILDEASRLEHLAFRRHVEINSINIWDNFIFCSTLLVSRDKSNSFLDLPSQTSWPGIFYTHWRTMVCQDTGRAEFPNVSLSTFQLAVSTLVQTLLLKLERLKMVTVEDWVYLFVSAESTFDSFLNVVRSRSCHLSSVLGWQFDGSLSANYCLWWFFLCILLVSTCHKLQAELHWKNYSQYYNFVCIASPGRRCGSMSPVWPIVAGVVHDFVFRRRYYPIAGWWKHESPVNILHIFGLSWGPSLMSKLASDMKDSDEASLGRWDWTRNLTASESSSITHKIALSGGVVLAMYEVCRRDAMKFIQ